MSVITFYSYKGGVGRSMALANIAVLLARGGHRVLVVDWDLEAPGIEKYFADLRMTQSGLGLLPLLREVASGNEPDYADFTWKVAALDGAFEFSFLHSGREADPDYFQHLEQFLWPTFFSQGGGNFLEKLRERWLDDFDFVLVDSRTGLSDAGGICTIQLPDIVVALFTPARQSLFGVRDVMRLAQTARQRLAFDREALSIVPVPSRVDREQGSFAGWMDQFATELKEFFSDWLPRDGDRGHALQRLALDHSRGVVHGERLAVLESSADCEALASTYDRLATLLASDLQDVSSILTPTLAAPAPTKSERTGQARREPKILDGQAFREPLEYEHDLFVSYPRSELTTRWLVDHLLPLMSSWLELDTGRVNLFIDKAEISAGHDWVEAQRRALRRSKLLLAIWTPSYFRSRWCIAEFKTFSLRSELVHQPLIVPITIHGADSFPAEAQAYQWEDFSKFMIVGDAFRKTEGYVDFQERVRSLCRAVAKRLAEVPPCDPDWPVVEPRDDVAGIEPLRAPRVSF